MNMFNNPMGNMGNRRRPEENMKQVSACPLCGMKYNPAEAQVVAEKESAFLLYTSCKRCGSSVVATLIASPMGVSSVGLITDLTYKDVLKFMDANAVTTNDILGVYKWLNEFEGDIRSELK